jgi:hypothetical protein
VARPPGRERRQDDRVGQLVELGKGFQHREMTDAGHQRYPVAEPIGELPWRESIH